MTIDQLKCFQTIISAGSFRAASEQLNRAQSAVSYAVRTLEEELGFDLFDRSQYRPILTPMGRSFHQKTVEFLAHYEQLEQTAQYLKRGHEPVLKIAVSAHCPLPFISKALCQLRAKFKDTEIKIYQEVLSATEMLENEDVDIALSPLPGDNDKIKKHKLFDVPLVSVCSPDHPLAKLKGKAKESELKSYPQIVLRSTIATPRRAGVLNPGNTISVGEFLSKKSLLMDGVGWGSMPLHLVKDELKKKQLVITHSLSLEMPISVAIKAERPLGPCGKFLWEYFLSTRSVKN